MKNTLKYFEIQLINPRKTYKQFPLRHAKYITEIPCRIEVRQFRFLNIPPWRLKEINQTQSNFPEVYPTEISFSRLIHGGEWIKPSLKGIFDGIFAQFDILSAGCSPRTLRGTEERHCFVNYSSNLMEYLSRMRDNSSRKFIRGCSTNYYSTLWLVDEDIVMVVGSARTQNFGHEWLKKSVRN